MREEDDDQEKIRITIIKGVVSKGLGWGSKIESSFSLLVLNFMIVIEPTMKIFQNRSDLMKLRTIKSKKSA